MVRISTNQFKNGITIEHDGQLFDMVEFQFVKPGKGVAFVRTRLKNVKTGKILEVSFNSKDTVEMVNVDKYEMEYLYREGDMFVFMEPETFEQVHVEKRLLEPLLPLLKENTHCSFKKINEEIISVELPDFVVLKVVDTQQWLKGSTATSSNKPAKVETGATVNVPVFIDNGEMIRIDTRTNAYVERA